MVSFNADGKFTIKQGQGITQGIQEELQLSDAECKQLGSIWNKVIEEVKTDGNVKVKNNHNEKPNEGNNFRVHENAVIEFTSASWNKILMSDGTTKNTALTRMIKLLVHETYHNYLDMAGHHGDEPTKKEEATCEMLALMVTANLCNNDLNLPSFEEYGHPITYYTSKDSVAGNQQFVSWVGGYDKHTGEANDSIREAKEDIKL